MNEREGMKVEEASQVVKAHAAKQPVRIELTDEQLETLREQWGKMDPAQPLEITFLVADRTVGELKVASCAYVGDTCCA